MIRIQKGETKEVVFTLKEKGSLSTPYYFFSLYSNDNNTTTLFSADDISNNKDRYNSFTFSEGVTATHSGGFNLPVGTYDYTVYETQYDNNISVASASNTVEIGLLEIYGTQSTYLDYNTIDDEQEYTYEPE